MRLFIFAGTVGVMILAGATATRAQAAAQLAAESPLGASPNVAASADAESLAVDTLPDAPVPASPAMAAGPEALTMDQTYQPMTGKDRLWWMFINTVGPQHLAGGVISAAYGTAVNHPHEYGTHWGGFGERYGIRLTGVATSNVMEAGLGAIWGEDPRYFRVPERSLGGRARNIVKQTFEARHRDGNFQVAYARIMAITGSNFLSNTWRANSEADSAHAAYRTLEGFAGRLAGNTWDEFWPSIRARSLHK